MPQIVYDIIVRINVVSFFIALADKIAAGRLAVLFWLSVLGFGAGGSAMGCFLFRHRTENGDSYVVIFFLIVQFAILWLLEKIF